MPEFLVLHMPAPMASWGGIAKGEVRPTDATPTRSALLGLLAAALGIERHEDERLQALAAGTQFAIEEISSGQPLVDYHTFAPAKPPKKREVFPTRRDEVRRGELNTIVSQRFYRSDAWYRVAVWTSREPEWSRDDLSAALRRPHFTLYLGRKSCPLVAPLAPVKVTAESILEAFLASREQHHPISLFQPETSTAEYHWPSLPESSPLHRESGVKVQSSTTRFDDPASRPRSAFRERLEHAGHAQFPNSAEGAADVSQ